jgi:hypothetical protein
MANPGPAIAGIANSEAYISTGPLQRVIYPTGFTNGNAIGNGTLSFQYFNCTYPISASRLDLLVEVSGASAATAATAAPVISAIGGIYSNFASTNTAGTTSYLSLLSGGSTAATYSYASNNSGNSQLITAAIRPISVPVGINMAPGEYFIAFGISTTASSVGLTTTALGLSMSVQAALTNQTAINYAEFGNVTTANSNLYYGMGVYSATTGALPLTVPVTQVNQTGANLLDANFAFVMRNY